MSGAHAEAACRVRLSELWGGELVPCRVGRDAVFLVRVGDDVHAYRDKCPHLGYPLSEGHLDGTTLTCRAHHHSFDVVRGVGVNPPGVALAAYVVAIDGDDVTITAPAVSASDLAEAAR